MDLQFILPGFREADRLKKNIRKLDHYDPLMSIIKERFQLEVTNHLTSLKEGAAFAEKRLLPDRENGNGKPAVISGKETYLEMGKQHAVTFFLFDLARTEITTESIRLLYEILYESNEFRSSEISFFNQSGEKQEAPNHREISELVSKMVDDYQKVRQQTHPLVAASFLHQQFTAIQPFDDANGRIGRLLLNVALMQNDFLPILILPGEKEDYYERLEKADKGDLAPFAEFITQKEIDTLEDFSNSPEYLSILGKYELEQQLKQVQGSEKCIVLTEDSQTGGLLQIILESSGFRINETNIISYEGCSKLDSANLFSIFVKEKMPHVKIIVHRDRDYLTDAEIDRLRSQFQRISVNFFVTRGTDIESHFLNAAHIRACHPEITTQKARQLINDTLHEIMPVSIEYLRKKEFGNNRPEIYSHLNKAINDLVQNSLFRFTHGKTALRLLKTKLQRQVRGAVRIEKPSRFLCDERLEKIARSIWGS